jgi:endonuclease/exonuclease/phosphatase family metal-dependent hydrolase
MEFVRRDKRGDGSACSTGWKVLCRERLDPNYDYYWFGTAPACAADRSECTSRGLEYVKDDDAGDGNKCVTGHKVQCRVRKPPPAPAAGPDQLSVLAYNIYMRPTTLFKNGQAIRAELIPPRVTGYDALILSEAFDDDVRRVLLVRLRERGYPHATPVVGTDRGLEQDGGVLIVSRWPIGRHVSLRFGSTCAGSDCRADKGVMYARIDKQGRAYHLFGTHTNADKANRQVRAQQFRLLRRFIDDQRIPPGEAVLVGGDLNVDRAEREEFQAMLQILGAAALPFRGHGFTYDGRLNQLCSGREQEYLDYVLYLTAHRQPRATASYQEARVLRSAAVWREYGFEKWFVDLSDHYPVLGFFDFGR